MIVLSFYDSDICKDIDFINHQFLIETLNAYGVVTNSLCLLSSLFDKTKQRTKMNGFTVILMTVLVAFHKVPYYLHNFFNFQIYYIYTSSSELNVALKKLKT